jgi:hypothetical protein
VRANFNYHFDASRCESKNFNIQNSTNNFDYGLNGCLGVQFKSGIGVELAIVYGLNAVFNNNSDDIVGYVGYPPFDNRPVYIPEEAKGKNTVIAISFYALFGKTKKTE